MRRAAPRATVLAASVCCLAGLPPPARAAVSVWIGNSGNFTSSGNWSAGVPQSADVAIFRRGNIAYNVTFPGQGLSTVHYVNDVLRVYHTDGSPATGVVDLNTFYGYAAAINRTTGARGPTITDPVCIYDQAIGRFVHVVLTLDHVGTTANLSGTNHLDIAVSNTGDPTGGWTICGFAGIGPK